MTNLPKRKSPADCSAEISRFNAAHPLGSPVVVRLSLGDRRETTIKDAAKLHCGNTPVVELAGLPIPIALRDVTAVAPKQEELL